MLAYSADFARDREAGHRWWSSAPDRREALTRAFYDWEEDTGEAPRRVLNSHQRRLGYLAISQAEAAAQRHLDVLADSASFEVLLRSIECVFRIEGLYSDATLLAYDVAERFGRYIGQEPNSVYLHAGTWEGAKALGIEGPSPVPRERFGPVLGRLSASEIENFLCICKHQLRRAMLLEN